MMSEWILGLLLVVVPQGDFSHFSFCRTGPVAGDEVYCVELSPEGEGRFRIGSDSDGGDEHALRLSPSAARTYLELLSATDFLREGDQYESERRVAALGMKTLVVEGEWGRREAVFNYSARSEVMALVSFFDRLVAQELLTMDIELAQRFDPLSMPGNLERLERDLDADRLADVPRLVPLLEGLAEDRRLLSLVRSHASRLKEEIEDRYLDR